MNNIEEKLIKVLVDNFTIEELNYITTQLGFND